MTRSADDDAARDKTIVSRRICRQWRVDPGYAVGHHAGATKCRGVTRAGAKDKSHERFSGRAAGRRAARHHQSSGARQRHDRRHGGRIGAHHRRRRQDVERHGAARRRRRFLHRPPPRGSWRISRSAAAAADALGRRDASDAIFNCYGAFRRAAIPIIGVVRGRALGFGCAIAALCDITLAGERAQFQVPEYAHNIMPTMVMSALLDRVPRKALNYLVYSTQAVGAERALACGLASEVGRRPSSTRRSTGSAR